MYEWEVQVRRPWKTNDIARIIESTAAKFELTQSMKSTLRTYRGCVHWHFKRSRAGGTIEMTMWPKEKRVWISVQKGRAAEWIDRDAPKIQRGLQRALSVEY